jgi:hypothetical protein
MAPTLLLALGPFCTWFFCFKWRLLLLAVVAVASCWNSIFGGNVREMTLFENSNWLKLTTDSAGPTQATYASVVCNVNAFELCVFLTHQWARRSLQPDEWLRCQQSRSIRSLLANRRDPSTSGSEEEFRMCRSQLCLSLSSFELGWQARPGRHTGIRLHRPVLTEGQNKSWGHRLTAKAFTY